MKTLTIIKIALVLSSVSLLLTLTNTWSDIAGPIISFLVKRGEFFAGALLGAFILYMGIIINMIPRKTKKEDRFANTRNALKHAMSVANSPEMYANIDGLKSFQKYNNLKNTDGFKPYVRSAVHAILSHFDYESVFKIDFAEGRIEWNPADGKFLAGKLQEILYQGNQGAIYNTKQSLKYFLIKVQKLDDKVFEESGSKKALILFLQENLDSWKRACEELSFFFDITFEENEKAIQIQNT
jgi:hypothetical protein